MSWKVCYVDSFACRCLLQLEVILTLLGTLLFSATFLYVLETKNPFYNPNSSAWRDKLPPRDLSTKSYSSYHKTNTTFNKETHSQSKDNAVLQSSRARIHAVDHNGGSSANHNCRICRCGVHTFTGSLSALFGLMLNEGITFYSTDCFVIKKTWPVSKTDIFTNHGGEDQVTFRSGSVSISN